MEMRKGLREDKMMESRDLRVNGKMKRLFENKYQMGDVDDDSDYEWLWKICVFFFFWHNDSHSIKEKSKYTKST